MIVTNEEKERARDAYVDAHVRELWEKARRGFRDFGRGVLVVEGDTRLPRTYVPIKIFAAAVPPEFRVFIDDIDRYDPAKQFVLLYSESAWNSSVGLVVEVVV